MRLALHAAVMLLFVCFGLSHAQAELPYDQFKNACVGECSKGADKDYCSSYCECTLDGVKASGDEAKQTAIVTNPPELNKIAMTCGGKLGLVLFVKTCKANCQGAACSRCDCLLNEVKALGSDQKIGEFFMSVGRAEPAATSQMSAMQTKCTK